MKEFIELTGKGNVRILERKTNIVAVTEGLDGVTYICTAQHTSAGNYDYPVLETYDEVKRLLGKDDKGGISNG